MRDDSVLAAIDQALETPTFCVCGKVLMLRVHDGAAWLECEAFSAPTRTPVAITAILRPLFHDRRFVVEVPELVAAAA